MPQPKEQKELSGNSVIEVKYQGKTLIKMDAWAYVISHLITGFGSLRWMIPDTDVEIYVDGVLQIAPSAEDDFK